MKRIPYRAIIVDFDRTLLHTDKTISAETVKILTELQAARSGRSRHTVK